MVSSELWKTAADYLPTPDIPSNTIPEAQIPTPDELQGLTEQAKQGDTASLLRLGEIYDLGLGVPASAQDAMQCYQAAANADDAEAFYRLGLFYINGRHVKKSLDNAAPYLVAAAERGHAKAMNLLALDYSLGGDGKNALLYYDKAARLGVIRSQLALGDLFHTGYRGIVSPNSQYSLYWYCRAYLQGSKDAAQRLNKLIASPRKFQGGLLRVKEMLQMITDEEIEPPTILFVKKKKRHFWKRKAAKN